jgi:IS30 family transposase
VKKGPGRRPLSAKRQRFMELRAQGWSIRGAAREVGISRSAAANWTRGYTQQERIEIADLHHEGVGVREISRRVGRSPSTISRELKRNRTGGRRPGYRPFEAHRRACARRVRRRDRRIETNYDLGRVVAELLGQRWSPEQISRQLRKRFPEEPAMWLSHESIYQAVYEPGSPLMQPTRLAPHRRSPLRTGRDHRRAQQRTDRRRSRFEQPMLTIHERPADVDSRSEAGHWEGDLIVGKNQGSAIGTLVERQTRLVRLLHLPCRDADSLHEALQTRMGDLPGTLLRSITWDQGTEMARHLSITKSLGVPVYFCDSRSPWRRGSNENTNGLLRDYFPKGTDLTAHTVEHLLVVENELNDRPRIVLNDRPPQELFDALIAC